MGSISRQTWFRTYPISPSFKIRTCSIPGVCHMAQLPPGGCQTMAQAWPPCITAEARHSHSHQAHRSWSLSRPLHVGLLELRHAQPATSSMAQVVSWFQRIVYQVQACSFLPPKMALYPAGTATLM